MFRQTAALTIIQAMWMFVFSSSAAIGQKNEDVDFSRDIRPILADKCFHCHGPDSEHREADLRLDLQEQAAGVVVAGRADKSKLVRRMESTDPNEVMPPPESGKHISNEEIRLLKRWINSGATWAQHWSFQKPVKADLPNVSNPEWCRNPIDFFVMSKLDSKGLKPSRRAELSTLARRVSFDLTGLPPSSEQLQQLAKTPTAENYEKLVDQLLSSGLYGERMAMVWLDAARYADSDGYQADATRQNWPWRDWVIDAYNSNMPFDEFTIQQFAGDLLKDATAENILATCFHRNHMHNGEGGRDPEESRIDYVIDRVNTMGSVWLGLTLGCCQCHSHKYDPISQTEYYQLNAYFNSIDENGKAGSGAGPFLKFKSPYVVDGLADATAWLDACEKQLQQDREKSLANFDAWLLRQQQQIASRQVPFRSWHSFESIHLKSTGGTQLVQSNGTFEVSGADPRHDDYLIEVKPSLQRVTGMRLNVLPSPAANGHLSRSKDGHFILTNLKVRIKSADGHRERPVPIARAVASNQAAASGRIYGPVNTVLDDDPRTGWTTTGSSSDAVESAAFALTIPIQFTAGETLVVELRQRSLRGYSNVQRFTLEFTDEFGPTPTSLQTTPLETLMALQHDEGSPLQSTELPKVLRTQLQDQFLAEQRNVLIAEEQVASARKRHQAYLAAAKDQAVTVLKERQKPRDTHVLIRGVWNNKGNTVQPGTPVAISKGNSAPQDRLELAQWLVSKNNPLTARVTVNRYWQMYFGQGLVRTPDDFGNQGEPPTHPELLDWLAVEFMDSGWDIRHIQQLIVSSATYQQSSSVTSAQLSHDPDNRLLARQTRFRHPSWMIRDGALAGSGLLDHRIGGPPVFPFQPEGAWLDATMGRFRYEPSVGNDRYRRSIYTFWRRSVGPTGMFDASKRRVCSVRSYRTNTPLHALTLLNDETFFEASRALASHCSKPPATISPPQAIQRMFVQAVSRSPGSLEMQVLLQQFENHVQTFTESPETARQLLKSDQSETLTHDVNMAAYTMLASTILNLDECMTHE